MVREVVIDTGVDVMVTWQGKYCRLTDVQNALDGLEDVVVDGVSVNGYKDSLRDVQNVLELGLDLELKELDAVVCCELNPMVPQGSWGILMH